MNSVMTQVMDQSQASGQLQLLTELHSRFPEVPVDIIKVIMQQVSCRCGCCVACKYHTKTALLTYAHKEHLKRLWLTTTNVQHIWSFFNLVYSPLHWYALISDSAQNTDFVVETIVYLVFQPR